MGHTTVPLYNSKQGTISIHNHKLCIFTISTHSKVDNRLSSLNAVSIIDPNSSKSNLKDNHNAGGNIVITAPPAMS